MAKHGYGQRLRDFIKFKELKSKDVAEFLGYTPTAVSEWISEKSKPNILDLKKLAEFYYLNLNWFITGKGEMIINAELTFKNVLDPSDKIKINEFFINRNIKLCDKVHELNDKLVECQKKIIKLQQKCIEKNEKENKQGIH